MDLKRNSAKSTLIQIIIFLLAVAALTLVNKGVIENLYNSGEISKTGMIINAIIIGLFFLGMLRIVMVLVRYINEHQVSVKLVEYLKENAANPIARLPEKSLAVQRFNAIKWVSQQGSQINHAAMAASCGAAENSRLTLIRFVHSTLILAGVFGTVVSLSMALVGAAGLLNSPEGVKEMGTIISSMSSALSSTVTAIVCFFIFAYFYLRLNDARIQMLSNIEDLTSLYLLPKVTHTEEGMVHKVAELTVALNKAADRLLVVEQTFINAGERLQSAVNDLHGQVSSNSLEDIKDLIRKGFHLSEPEYDSVEEARKLFASDSDKNSTNSSDEIPTVSHSVKVQ
jgi:ABC-type multidrug transport system fused ATPase/permease subunit